jgi:proteasome accessory factor A
MVLFNIFKRKKNMEKKVKLVSPSIMGIETEYGITADASFFTSRSPSQGRVELCKRVLEAHPSAEANWNYELETPLLDMRGFTASFDDSDKTGYDHGGRAPAHDKMLANGARFYIDMDHPEYSTPECASALDLVARDKAGEFIVGRAADKVNRTEGIGVKIYKHNTDFKGRSFGCHEGYLARRDIPLERIISAMVPFLVTRQVFCGSGKVGGESSGRYGGSDVDYQISQRADFISSVVGVQTTRDRPVFNTRDEPHADGSVYRRIHVILGDANMSEWSTYLKCGTTNLVIKAIEAGFLEDPVSIDEPVSALRLISRDLGCKGVFPTSEGNISAIDLQELYVAAVLRLGERGLLGAADNDVISRWQEVLSALRSDPMQLGERLDWVIKYQLLDSLKLKRGWADRSWEMKGADMQYHRVDGKKGLYSFLCDEGRVERLVDDASVVRAVRYPPKDTRAYFRGNVIRYFPDEISCINWESIGFVGGDSIHFNPDSLTEDRTGSLFESSESISELLEAVRKR